MPVLNWEYDKTGYASEGGERVCLSSYDLGLFVSPVTHHMARNCKALELYSNNLEDQITNKNFLHVQLVEQLKVREVQENQVFMIYTGKQDPTAGLGHAQTVVLD